MSVSVPSSGPSASPCWFVGAVVDGRDQTDRFIDEGIWEHGFDDDRIAAQVRSMRLGDRIAIKAAYTQKHGLPFDTNGNTASVMKIKATGVVAENPGDGRQIRVHWQRLSAPREWFFYTHRRTIWRVLPGEWQDDALIAFTFQNQAQDLHRFRNSPFWRDRFGDASTSPHRFRWASFYQAIADALRAHRHDRQSLIRFLQEAQSRVEGLTAGDPPSRQQIANERFGRHDAIDQPMLAAARLAMDLALPTEAAGPHALLDPKRCVHGLRRLYEKAIGGFYRLHLNQSEWMVSTGRPLSWPLQEATSGIAQVFPSMRTDIVIDHRERHQRLVIDTKFTGVFARGWYRDQTLRAGYVYQLYAYLRSQEGQDNPAAPWADSAAGLLLHPAIDTEVDESVQIQGHRLRFATVDLTASHADLRARLLQLASQE